MTPAIFHRNIKVNGLNVFYREAGPADAPTLLLLHGFPSSSRQYVKLMEALADRYHLVAPDYPGFGLSDAPAATEFAYSFDSLTDVVEGFCQALGLDRFVAYLFDFGAPVGLRLAERHPEWVAGLVIQNGNAYEEGLSPMARDLVALRPGRPGAEEAVMGILTAEVTRMQYLGGTREPERIAPEGWLLDQHFLDLPGRKAIQVDLALDYHRNVERYPAWQAWLRQHRPPALVVWGRNDAFFPAAGAEAYLRDLPEAELHLLDTGHFALEEEVDFIAARMAAFVDGLRLRPAAAR
ncbi:pimeloyl-ACP methyl ester carboxylesterase [Pelomonas saccharophila]|uniref:Pimeloyl-ACP methyl ester carboxylesterase n=1 Tax=Roseateles saccharophilus TaxID=304 RepID=A0ABU1YW73_ROSSA|nr:alpha/beta hydrolase [Roseateles saccharophilus]MDR7273083.1 pimeloyl-ACP methyl ester carboxylesterase [Roseateles saccharophilus]